MSRTIVTDEMLKSFETNHTPIPTDPEQRRAVGRASRSVKVEPLRHKHFDDPVLHIKLSSWQAAKLVGSQAEVGFHGDDVMPASCPALADALETLVEDLRALAALARQNRGLFATVIHKT